MASGGAVKTKVAGSPLKSPDQASQGALLPWTAASPAAVAVRMCEFSDGWEAPKEAAVAAARKAVGAGAAQIGPGRPPPAST